MLPVFKPCTGQEEADAVAEVLKSGWIGLGPKTAEFETKFAEYLGAPYCVGVEQRDRRAGPRDTARRGGAGR
jgi:perosamine synthetase